MRPGLLSVCLGSMLMFGSVPFAQDAVVPRVDSIVHVEGNVFVDDVLVDASVTPIPIKANSIVRTEDGRAEVTLTRGAAFFLGSHSAARDADNRDDNFRRLELLSGSAVVITSAGVAAMQCEDAVTLGERGVYRFDYRASTPRTIDDVCSLKVYAGAADVRMASMTAVLQAGTMMLINRHCGDMIPTYEVDVRTHDELDDWSRERARAR